MICHLRNIGKNANPTLVSIIAKKEHNQVHFVVQDNGQGFDAAQELVSHSSGSGIGLMAMEERLNMAGGLSKSRVGNRKAPGSASLSPPYRKKIDSDTIPHRVGPR